MAASGWWQIWIIHQVVDPRPWHWNWRLLRPQIQSRERLCPSRTSRYTVAKEQHQRTRSLWKTSRRSSWPQKNKASLQVSSWNSTWAPPPVTFILLISFTPIELWLWEIDSILCNQTTTNWARVAAQLPRLRLMESLLTLTSFSCTWAGWMGIHRALSCIIMTAIITILTLRAAQLGVKWGCSSACLRLIFYIFRCLQL